MVEKPGVEGVVREIKRRTRRKYSSEEKIRIVLEGLGERFSGASKLRNDYKSFDLLRKLGERAARRFLDNHFDDIGVRSSIDLKAELISEQVSLPFRRHGVVQGGGCRDRLRASHSWCAP